MTVCNLIKERGNRFYKMSKFTYINEKMIFRLLVKFMKSYINFLSFKNLKITLIT